MLKKVLKILGLVVLLVLVGAAGFYLWARSKATSRLNAIHKAHDITLALPFPLTKAEIDALRKANPDAKLDLPAVALSRAVKRGEHLVNARYACIECHGKDFGGGTMMDGMPVARLFGPNLTRGKGSKVLKYSVSDWDRSVRHGILPGGKAAVMPSEDYFRMSDRELSDIIAYIRSRPAVDRPSRPRELGIIGTVLMALGKLRLSAEQLENHHANHLERPPPTGVTKAFGRHLVNVCTGCHGADLQGGKVPGGDPKWPPASNITPSDKGIGSWRFADFLRALHEGKSKDGRKLRAPMSLMVPYAKRMTDTELRAMWTYLRSVPKKP